LARIREIGGTGKVVATGLVICAAAGSQQQGDHQPPVVQLAHGLLHNSGPNPKKILTTKVTKRNSENRIVFVSFALFVVRSYVESRCGAVV